MRTDSVFVGAYGSSPPGGGVRQCNNSTNKRRRVAYLGTQDQDCQTMCSGLLPSFAVDHDALRASDPPILPVSPHPLIPLRRSHESTMLGGAIIYLPKPSLSTLPLLYVYCTCRASFPERKGRKEEGFPSTFPPPPECILICCTVHRAEGKDREGEEVRRSRVESAAAPVGVGRCHPWINGPAVKRRKREEEKGKVGLCCNFSSTFSSFFARPFVYPCSPPRCNAEDFSRPKA